MKRRARYDWDRHNEGHIAAQRVATSAVEEVLANDPVRIATSTDVRSGEERVLELGHTNAGRVLYSRNRIEAEAAFAADIYRERAEVNRKAQEVLASGSRQITIRLDNDELARAGRQAEAKGLKYQTYIKMLLHEALARNPAPR